MAFSATRCAESGKVTVPPDLRSAFTPLPPPPSGSVSTAAAVCRGQFTATDCILLFRSLVVTQQMCENVPGAVGAKGNIVTRPNPFFGSLS